PGRNQPTARIGLRPLHYSELECAKPLRVCPHRQSPATLGGPVYIPKLYDGRNKTFFFAGIEFERFGGATVTVFNPTVPLAPWRAGDFSGLLPGTVVKDPF